MNPNLIQDPWIPMRHRSGARSTRAPWDLHGPADDPVVAVSSPRPDFDGALSELLIGLLHVVQQPEDHEGWLDHFDQPPTTDELRERMTPLAPAFDLLGPGPRYQQDPRVGAYGGPPLAAEKLLIDLGLSPGADHFGRNGSVGAICLSCAAAALTTLQTYAPAGGRGNLTSLRGGGPLTTLVIPGPDEARATLWHKLWLNVVPRESLQSSPVSGRALDAVFPWLVSATDEEPTRALERTPEDTHALQVFFGMPRRMWLSDLGHGDCGLCGARDTATVEGYQARPNGIRYAGAWEHPLSPHRLFKKDSWLPAKGDASGIGYRHWLGLAWSNREATDVRTAASVRVLRGNRARLKAAGEARLHAFGFAMDNMKARAWSEGEMPLYAVPDAVKLSFTMHVRAMIEGARLAEGYLRLAVKKLIARRPKDVKRDLIQTSTRFWQATENAFYERLRASVEHAGDDQHLVDLRRHWLRDLRAGVKALFEIEVGPSDFRAANPRQVATAWNDLQNMLHGPKIHSVLDVPKPPKKATKGATV